MEKIIRPALVFLAIICSSPFLSGAGVLNPDSGFAAPTGLSQPVITIATFYFFISFLLKIFDFFKKNKQ
ncbi:hypothetical protein AB6825_06325 [Serratia proteamaculans]|uniref:hypothetical protein n=1 Tax=Serratia proteamaculans TaxID=28151 RepID=UPI0039BE4408